MSKEKFSFEDAFGDLEKILDQMNEGNLSLDDALKLFEKGNGLLQTCDKFLHSAQQQVEQLIKQRDGQVETDNDKNVKTEPLSLNQQKIFSDSEKA